MLRFVICEDNKDFLDIIEPVFDSVNFDNCTLCIPSGTRWAYRHHSIFGKFKNIETLK